MSDSFQCPKCGASYARERRRVGKAVVCSCGHKFLVPPAGFDAPASYVPPPPAAANRTPNVRSLPPRKQTPPPASDDASGEVLPLAEPVAPPQSTPSGRWAEPIEVDEDESLPQAEIVYPAAMEAEPVAPAGDLFSPEGAYGDPFAAPSTYRPPLAVPPPPPKSPKRPRKKRRSSSDGGGIGFSHWVAYIVLFLLLPIAAILTVVGAVQSRREGPLGQPQQAAPARTRGAAPTETRPASSGLPITILNATKRAGSDEFTVEYRIGGLQPNGSSQYFWVVTAPQGRIEFPVSGNSWQQSGKLSGKPTAAANLSPPFTTFIEQQTGGTRTRVSNEVSVVVGS